MSSVLTSKWLWIIIASLIVILLVPLLVVWIILSLPPIVRVVATVLIVLGWAVASGYKDWILKKRQSERHR